MRPVAVFAMVLVGVSLAASGDPRALSAAQSSPQATVVAYVNGLAKGNLEPFFSYNWDFRFQVANMRHRNPQTLWPQKLEGLKSFWRRELSASVGVARPRQRMGFFRSMGGDLTTWDFLYEPGASASILEVRQGAYDREDVEMYGWGDFIGGPTWEAFIRVTYPSRSGAPRFPLVRESPHLQEVILKMKLWRLGPELKRLGLDGFILDASTEIVRLAVWPVVAPRLTAAVAQALLDANLRATAFSLNTGPHGVPAILVEEGNVRTAEEWEKWQTLLPELQKLGFVWKSAELDPYGPIFLVFQDLRYPPSVNECVLNRQRTVSDTFNVAVAMGKKLEIQVTNIRQSDRNATANWRYRWTGCRLRSLLEHRLSNGRTVAELLMRGELRFPEYIDVWSRDFTARFVWLPAGSLFGEGWRLEKSGRCHPEDLYDPC